MPIIGARRRNENVLITGSELIAENPQNEIASPAKDPINAWEEEDGIPYHQVKRFQKIADNKPAKITNNIACPLTNSGFTVFAIVLATP